jgi:hypothetical protein
MSGVAALSHAGHAGHAAHAADIDQPESSDRAVLGFLGGVVW